MADLCPRYVSESELRALLDEMRPAAEGAPGAAPARGGALPAEPAPAPEGSG